jgi:hypothetical protein
MKRLLLFIVIMGLFHWGQAQVKSPVMTGSATGRKELADKSVTFNVGSAIPYFYKGFDQNNEGEYEKWLQVGFPYKVLYVGEIFDGTLLVSKGYSGSEIALKWGIKSNAENITGFKIYRRKLGDNFIEIEKDYNKAERSYTDKTQLDANTVYEYKVFAVGIYPMEIPGINSITGFGFRQPTANIAGNITYAGGTGVRDVKVLAETSEMPAMYSALFNGTSSFIECKPEKAILINEDEGFTFQAYLKPDLPTGDNKMTIFACEVFCIYIQNSYVKCEDKVGNNIVNTTFSSVKNLNEYFHFSIVLTKNASTVYLDGENVAQGNGFIIEKLDSFSIGKRNIDKDKTDFYKGYIDEVRIWNQPLDTTDMKRDYNRYINGNEQGLIAYYRLNEDITAGFEKFIVDYSKIGLKFNENHAYFTDGKLNSRIPTTTQLWFKGISDETGYYAITGIPVTSAGASYTITPMYDNHDFQPDFKKLYIDENSTVHNNVDFTDNSSFSATLSVLFEGTSIGVEDVEVYIDDNALFNKDTKDYIKTNANGDVTISVPIGYHTVKLKKQGHIFQDSTWTKNFIQNEVSPKKFIDKTKVMVAGRIVGGTREGNKPLGFNLSENNLKNPVIKLKRYTDGNIQLTFGITDGNSIEDIKYSTDLNSTTRFTNSEIIITPDPLSGEFVAFVFPIKYEIEAISDESQPFTYFGGSPKLEYDLSVIPKDLLKSELKDETGKVIKSKEYQFEKKLIYRVNPTLAVTRNNDEHIGELKFKYNDADGNPQELDLKVNFKYPILQFGTKYTLKFKAEEIYTGYNNGEDKEFKYPVEQGKILIYNQCKINYNSGEADSIRIKEENGGEFYYSFKAGVPNLNKDIDELNSFTKTITAVLKTGDDFKKETYWPGPGNADVQRCYVIGEYPLESNDFVTVEASVPFLILRDPPGKNSYAFVEKGSRHSFKSSMKFRFSEANNLDNELRMGVGLKAGGGVVGPIVENKTENVGGLDIHATTSYTDEGEYVTTVEFNEKIQTSSEPDKVGAMADIYVGKAFNLVFTPSRNLKILPTSFTKKNIPKDEKLDDGNDKTFTLGIMDGITANDDLGKDTYFFYTQAHIVNTLIPGIEIQRNLLLKNNPKYKLAEDIDVNNWKFGLANEHEPITDSEGNIIEYKAYFNPENLTDIVAIKSVEALGENGKWLAYTFYPDKNENTDNDSVMYYNRQIGKWIGMIQLNEQEKVLALENLKNNKDPERPTNISFDGGVGEISKSFKKDFSQTDTYTKSFQNDFDLYGKFGNIFNDAVGIITTAKIQFDIESVSGTTSEDAQSVTFGYVISDGDVGDYYSVDVFERINEGNYKLDSIKKYHPTMNDIFILGGFTNVMATGVASLAGSLALNLGSAVLGGSVGIIAKSVAYIGITAGIHGSYESYFNKFQEKQDDLPGTSNWDISGFELSSPIFSVVGGSTRCPWQGSEYSNFYFDPGTRQPYQLHYATLQREKPKIVFDNNTINNVPATSKAYFTMTLENNSESKEDQWYNLRVLEGSNTNGAVILMDGTPANNRTILVPYGKPVKKSLTIHPSNPAEIEFNKIGIILHSVCQYDPTDFMPDIADTAYIWASFVPSCSPVNISSPNTNWVINKNGNKMIPLKIDGFDINYTGFKYLVLQSKSSHSGTWGNRVAFAVNDGDIETIKTEKSIQDVRSISELQNSTFNSSFDGLGNGPKDIRVISVCSDGTENSSNIISGMFDDRPPRVFGNPQPADGILSAGDDLSIEFNEPIDQNYLYSFNKSWFFQIRGTTSYDSLRHVSYAKFEDKDDKLVIPNTLSLANKPFTIEFWLKRNNQNQCVFLSQGGISNELKIEFNDNKTIFSLGGESFVADLLQSLSIPWDDWNHFAYTYDYNNGAVEIYQNDNTILQKQLNLLQVLNIPTNPIILGNNGNAGFSGFMHELRIWNKYLSHGDVYSKQSISLTGNEYGLYGYWPMNEADGSIIRDYAANRHIESTAGWEVHPIGFSGGFVNNKYLTLNTSDVVIEPEMDYTIEFWFKREASSAEVTLFSNQTGEEQSNSLKQKTMSIRGTTNELKVYSNKVVLVVPAKNCFNNQWHHFALIVKRMGGVKVLIDGEVVLDNFTNELGGLAGSKMTLGALFANEEFNTLGSYFGGYIDEFRIWDLARKVSQINLYKNTKLHGDEFGLKFYLPFEEYMADEINPNYFKKSLINYTKDAADSFQSSDFNLCSDISPNIKDVKSVVDINFDFVPSENKIVFNTPEALLHELEKNLVEISVKNVSDLYGNIMSSPETWTAYVSRNQVRWEDERRTFTKEIYKPMEFVSTIKNTSGQQIGFTITNLPAWLTAIPSSGVLNPESTLEIKFTVNPAINIGEYNQDIILRTDNGFDEKLPLSVMVYKKPPNWKVNPAEFEESMSIVGSVKIEEVLSTDIFDMVAAFKRGTDLIRGVTNVRYVKEFDSYLVFLSVYGNDTNPDQNIAEYEELEFRIWDASAGQILEDVKLLTYNNSAHEDEEMKVFVPKKVIGTTRNPARFEANRLYRQYIPLAKGWNWVSFNKESSNMDDLNVFFSSLEPNKGDQIKYMTGFNTYETNPVGIFNIIPYWNNGSIDKIDFFKMYQIKVSKADTIVYSGNYIEPENEEIQLEENWNHIGYLPDLSMDVNDALRLYIANNSEVIKSQFAFSMYDDRVGWVGTLEMMQPGLGYMLKVNKAATLKYPNSTVFKGAKMPLVVSPPLGWNKHFSGFEGNISVVARLDLSSFSDLNIKNDLVLGAFINKECRGFISPLRNSGFGYEPFFLTVSNSENGQLVGFRLYDGASGNSYSIAETVPFIADAVYGTIAEPLVLTLKSLITGEGGMDNSSFIRIYPNPFDEKVYVEFAGTGRSVTIDVVNATGSVVKSIYNGYAVSGMNIAVWDGTNQNDIGVSAGIYYIRFISGETVNTVKISKTR